MLLSVEKIEFRSLPWLLSRGANIAGAGSRPDRCRAGHDDFKVSAAA